MAKRKNCPSEGLSDGTGNPQQFRIVDLFAHQLAIEDHASPECVDSKNYIAGSTIMAQVFGELRERVFAAANSAHEENRDDSVTQ